MAQRRRQRLCKSIIVTTVMLLSTSCLHAQPIDAEEIAGLSAALLKVSSSVHTAVRFKNPDPALHDSELLVFSTAHMPSYLNRFNGYVLKARQEGANSSVLVCDPEGKLALIEDAGCTGTSDWHAPTTERTAACEFVLDLAQICPAQP